MHPSAIIADKIRVLLATPMLYEFMSLALYQEDAWACELASRVSALVQDEVPNIREWSLDAGHTAALCTNTSCTGAVHGRATCCATPGRRTPLQAIVLADPSAQRSHPAARRHDSR